MTVKPARSKKESASAFPIRRGRQLSIIVALALLCTAAAAQRVAALGTGQFSAPYVTFQADSQQAQDGVYLLSGHVEIDYGPVRFTADQIRYDRNSGEAVAAGHVALDLPAEETHVEGSRGRYNFRTESGEFDDFHGVSGIRFSGRKVSVLTRNPLIFSGRKLLRLGPNHYRLEGGMVTSCRLPHPKWTLSAQRVDVELGANATLHNAVFRLFDVPVFYAPYLTHSTQISGRHSGFLLPIIGQNTQKGTVLGDSYFWAPNRSTNVTAGAQYFSRRGWADLLGIQAFPTRRTYLQLNLSGVMDRGLPAANGGRIKQGGQELNLLATFEPKGQVAQIPSMAPVGTVPGEGLETGSAPPPVSSEEEQSPGVPSGDFRTVLDANYLSSFIYRLAFTETFAEAINSEVVSTAFTERQSDGRDLSFTAHRYQNFLTATPSTSVSLASFPSAEWGSQPRPLTSPASSLPVYFSWDLEAAALDRLEPGFQSGVMDRVDLYPRLTVPLWTPAGSITGDVSVRSTSYSRRLTPAPLGAPAPILDPHGGLERFSQSADLTWTPPSIERIFSTPGGLLGDRLKHVFEPLVAFHYTGGIDNADDVIRFDDRDILGNTRELEYGFTNRLYARTGSGPERELASWTLTQKYFFDPTFGGALTPGAENVFLTTALLTPFAFATLPSHESPISSVVRVSPIRGFDGDWRFDYDTRGHRLGASAFTGTFHVGELFFSGSHFLVNTPLGLVPLSSLLPARFNQLHFTTGYGDPERPGWSVAVAAAYDAHQGLLQYTTVQTSYNWDCCGFSVQYRRFALAALRRENQFRFNFTLANVATFGNLRRQERLY
ncbi:MAG: LPS-assembly protein LptD [Terriglobales bacterium]